MSHSMELRPKDAPSDSFELNRLHRINDSNDAAAKALLQPKRGAIKAIEAFAAAKIIIAKTVRS